MITRTTDGYFFLENPRRVIFVADSSLVASTSSHYLSSTPREEITPHVVNLGDDNIRVIASVSSTDRLKQRYYTDLAYLTNANVLVYVKLCKNKVKNRRYISAFATFLTSYNDTLFYQEEGFIYSYNERDGKKRLFYIGNFNTISFKPYYHSRNDFSYLVLCEDKDHTCWLHHHIMRPKRFSYNYYLNDYFDFMWFEKPKSGANFKYLECYFINSQTGNEYALHYNNDDKLKRLEELTDGDCPRQLDIETVKQESSNNKQFLEECTSWKKQHNLRVNQKLGSIGKLSECERSKPIMIYLLNNEVHACRPMRQEDRTVLHETFKIYYFPSQRRCFLIKWGGAVYTIYQNAGSNLSNCIDGPRYLFTLGGSVQKLHPTDFKDRTDYVKTNIIGGKRIDLRNNQKIHNPLGGLGRVWGGGKGQEKKE